MNARTVREWLHELVQRYGLREMAERWGWVGIYRGILMKIEESEGTLYCLFSGSGIDLTPHSRELFFHFTRTRDVGIVQLRLRLSDENPSSFTLTLDGEDLDRMGRERFLAFPESITADFHAQGASEEAGCHSCGAVADQVANIDAWLYPYCVPCFESLKAQAPKGKLDRGEPVLWGRVLPLLAITTLVGGFAWGRLRFSTTDPGMILFVVPFVFGIIVTYLIQATKTGINLPVCVGAVFAVVVAILIGNIYGYGLWVRAGQQFPVWGDVIVSYFTDQLPNRPGEELLYLLGGAFGGWVALSFLRPLGQSKVR